MKFILRKSQTSDLSFMKEILYEAVFWRVGVERPSFEEALALPDSKRCLADWGKRDGDTAVIALKDSTPVGVAWYRYFTDDNHILGYIDEHTPTLVIGVHRSHRHQGIGGQMMGWLIEQAEKDSIPRISLNVGKDNYALKLYQQQSFEVYEDLGDRFVMVREIKYVV